MFRFERLQVWHKAIALYDMIDALCEMLAAQSQYILADHLRRAALSVSSNIAEGAGRDSPRDSRHFYAMARASLFEVVSVAAVCQRRKLLTGDQYRAVYSDAEEISKMLTALKGIKRPQRASGS
jgi:four helix bundle protein